MATAFGLAFGGDEEAALGTKSGFFSWVDGAPATGYRAPRDTGAVGGKGIASQGAGSPDTVVTGEYGAMVLRPLLRDHPEVDLLPVPNSWFGGNIAVTGLLVGADVRSALLQRAPTGRVLLPDVCLSQGIFLDGTSVADLPLPVEVVPADGLSLRSALQTSPPAGPADSPQRVPVSVGGTRS
jgi:hypothetical protein